jgi:hypothetical protein
MHRRNTTCANYCLVVFRADIAEMIGSIRFHTLIDASVDPTDARCRTTKVSDGGAE